MLIKVKEIYLDNSATTPLSDAAKKAMCEAMEVYGNPSSLHTAGLSAEKIVRTARENVASALGIRNLRDAKLIFTSCGSEASNLAILGTTHAKSRRIANRILTTDSEHPSVENPIRKLEGEGFDIIRIPTKNGVLDFDVLGREAHDVFLASFMMVNNETGAIYDVERAFKLIRAENPDAILHCDAVQGFLKRRFSASSLGADLITVSAHKIHGPKGVGALYIAPEMIKAKKIVPVLLGGGQEGGFRSGTENVVGIAGFGAAAKEGFANLASDLQKMRSVKEHLISSLPSEIKVNAPAGESAPHVISITLPDIKSETMLHFLSSKGIYVSSGSACSSHSSSPSSSLISFGLDAHSADCTLRVSISNYTEKEDADALCEALREGIGRLVRIQR